MEDEKSFERTPKFSLIQGAQLDLAGHPEALWTSFEITGERNWLTRFHLGPNEARTVTVPPGKIDVYGELCLREKSEEPGSDLFGLGILEVSRGEHVDLTDPEDLEWEEIGAGSAMAILLLKGERPVATGKMTGAFNSAFPRAEEIELTQEGGEPVVTITLESERSVVACVSMSEKLPQGEAAAGADVSTFWPNGDVEATQHGSYMVFVCYSATDNLVDQAVDLTKAVRAAIGAAGERALGVLWGAGSAATRADVFMSLTEDANPETMPLDAWIRFQMILAEDPSKRGLITSGLVDFGLMEIEVAPCTRPYEEVSDLVHGVAHYLMSEGPVIGDGDTIGGTGEQKIKVTYGPGMLDEEYQVYQLHL